MFVVLFSVLFLTVGVMAGFIANEKWNQYLQKEKHEFDADNGDDWEITRDSA